MDTAIRIFVNATSLSQFHAGVAKRYYSRSDCLLFEDVDYRYHILKTQTAFLCAGYPDGEKTTRSKKPSVYEHEHIPIGKHRRTEGCTGSQLRNAKKNSCSFLPRDGWKSGSEKTFFFILLLFPCHVSLWSLKKSLPNDFGETKSTECLQSKCKLTKTYRTRKRVKK